MIVLDTNIVLDVLVFRDPATHPLQQVLQSGQRRWIATPAMREELARVLAYPQIAARLAFHQRPAGDVLADFDRWSEVCATAPKAPVTCKDADDQKFIDLAVAHRCELLSKDHAVLSMARRLQPLGVRAASTLQPG